jgi:hypothetical protein
MGDDKEQLTEMLAAQERAKARAANPLKLIVSGAERHLSEAIRVGAGRGKEYAIAAHRMLTEALKMIDEGQQPKSKKEGI